LYESTIATNSTLVYLSGHTIPANGDYVYDSDLCNNTYAGNSNYYAVLANSTRYTFTIGSGGYINNVSQCGAINTSATWTYQYDTCDNCTTYAVTRDTNVNSATYGRYKYNDIDRGTTAPSNGACPTPTQTLGTYLGEYWVCPASDMQGGASTPVSYPVYQNGNPCYTGIYQYNWDGTWHAGSNPVNSQSDVTGPIYELSSYHHRECVNDVWVYYYADLNPCSSTFGQYSGITSSNPCSVYSNGTFSYDAYDFSAACSGAALSDTFYWNINSSLTNGTTLYSDSGGVKSPVSQGYYSRSGVTYTVDSQGIITDSSTDCT
jgi:hypothetical protein